MLKPYLKGILEITRQGDAREESYYSVFEALLKEFVVSIDRRDIRITILPKKTDAGNPDFRIWDGKQKIVGYVEAKAPDKNLDEIEKTDQIKRYKTTFKNFILTNFIEFRLYEDGFLLGQTRIADPVFIYNLKEPILVKNEDSFKILLEKFFSFSFPSITTAQKLAVELAKRTRFLRDEVIAEELREEEKNGRKRILGFYEAFQKYLIRGLTKEQFADLYSQTITYGLFSSRMRCEGEFNRKYAIHDIPHSIGILRELFEFISLGDLSPQLECIVDEISYLLVNVDVKKIFSEYYQNKKGEDLVYHFYETFLAEYDPEERERRGVYYTPIPVVSYIVHSVHTFLKENFGIEDRLANENVTVLDPAAGTLTFITEAINQAVKEFTSKFGEGGREDFIKEHILKNFYAFELMIAPYAIGHLKVSFLFDELGHKLQKDERLKFYLTNTLEMEDIEQTSLPGMASLSEESHLAGVVKKKTSILIILGNPPYSGHSANKGQWISREIKEYYTVDGKPLDEKNPKWLQDDYVKFIRFAEWKINQTGKGVLGFITNHSYLDNPTFRGMRQHLMNHFDEIYILDLHGNSLKKEKCPDGSKDENVFDIRQGVAIGFFIKNKEKSPTNECKVFHSERWGLREKKYEWLSSHDKETTEWDEIQPRSPYYFFVPKKEKYRAKYDTFWKITENIPINSVGLFTARDGLTIKWSPDEVRQTVNQFAKMEPELARKTFNLGKDVRDWKVKMAQEDLINSGLKKDKIVPILYRPFDIRYTYYTGKSRGFHCMPRPKFMKHLMKKNVALCIGRAGQVVGLEKPWNIVFCSDHIIDLNLFYRGGSANFPLYLYDDQDKKTNISKSVFRILEKTYNNTTLPEKIFFYVYSILHSNIYRNEYAEFLRTDFPRVPFTSDYDLFVNVCKLGSQLIDLHLMKSKELNNPIAKFQGDGDNVVEKPSFNKKEGRVYINKSQFFEGIEEELWEYQIGGYQVLLKWLKDRQQRRLSLNDVKHYCKVVTALKRTIEIQEEIDKLYPEIENNLITFNKEKTSIEEYT